MTPNQNNNQPSKAEVQATKLNKVPTPENNLTEFSAEVAAEVFEQSDRQNNNKKSQNQQ